MNRKVTSIYVFYNGNQDALLTDYIFPLLSRYQKQESINDFFFLRYWNGGAHLRLRVFDCTEKESLIKDMEFALDSCIMNYPHVKQAEKEYERFSFKMKTFYNKFQLENVENVESLHHTPSIELVPYIFDHHIYGENSARTTSEDHFVFSSQLAYVFVRLTKDNLNTRLTLLLHVTMMVVSVIDQDPFYAASIFGQAAEAYFLFEADHNFVNLSFESIGLPNFIEQLPNLGDVIFQFEKWMIDSHTKEKTTTIEGATLMKIFGQTKEIEILLQQWQIELIQRKKELDIHFKNRLLQVDPLNVLMNYLHLLFNRVGISYLNECYVYYLVFNIINYSGKKLQERV